MSATTTTVVSTKARVADPHPDMDAWLDAHHRVEVLANGERISVFAETQGDVFSRTEGQTYGASATVGPLHIRLAITLTGSTLDISVYGKLPILPEFKIGAAKGDTKTGFGFDVDLKAIRGHVGFIVRNKTLVLQLGVKTPFKDFNGDINLIPLPI